VAMERDNLAPQRWRKSAHGALKTICGLARSKLSTSVRRGSASAQNEVAGKTSGVSVGLDRRTKRSTEKGEAVPASPQSKDTVLWTSRQGNRASFMNHWPHRSTSNCSSVVFEGTVEPRPVNVITLVSLMTVNHGLHERRLQIAVGNRSISHMETERAAASSG